MKRIGKLDWAFSAGRIPLESTGKEPEFISHDKIAVLNTSEEEALLELFIFYENEQPVGVFELKIKPRRLRKIRINDLIDPTVINLDRNYSCFIKASIPVVIQFSRINSATKETAEMGTMAFPVAP